jgi:hypothetical protein
MLSTYSLAKLGIKISGHSLILTKFCKNNPVILNVGITWISWGAAPGYINITPKGLEGSYLSFINKTELKNRFQRINSTQSIEIPNSF